MAAPGGISTTLTPSLEPHFTFIPGLKYEHRWSYRRLSNLVYSRFSYTLATKSVLPTMLRPAA